jgi:hypothetical protein
LEQQAAEFSTFVHVIVSVAARAKVKENRLKSYKKKGGGVYILLLWVWGQECHKKRDRFILPRVGRDSVKT